jgi:ribosome-associated translation inhibitor RaiA
MNVQINYKGIQPGADVEAFFETKSKKLGKFTRSFPEDAVQLRANLERQAHKEVYIASLRLSFPQKTLTAKETGPALLPVLHAAVENLLKQIEKFKSRLQREHLRRPGRVS